MQVRETTSRAYPEDAPDDGERYRDGRVRSPGPGAPDDQLVDPWNAAEAGA